MDKAIQSGVKSPDTQLVDRKAKKVQEKAKKCPRIMKALSVVVSVIMIIVAIVIAAFTWGAGSALVVSASVLAGAIVGAAVAQRGTVNLASRRRRRLVKKNDSNS